MTSKITRASQRVVGKETPTSLAAPHAVRLHRGGIRHILKHDTRHVPTAKGRRTGGKGRLPLDGGLRRRHVAQSLQEPGPPEPSGGGEEELLMRDLERFKQKEAGALQQGGRESSGGAVKEILDKVLIADFFFVCASLAWLLTGVLQQTTSGSSGLLDVWYKLWPLLFQPAIGVLMLGVLASGLLGRLSGGTDSR